MLTGDPSVFVIISTFNGIRYIGKCLNSIDKRYSVVIVDNGSVDGTKNFIKSTYPEFKLIGLKKNVGFGQANNIGIKYALKKSADYLFLLNQDAFIKFDCIPKLIHAHKGNPSFGILSPLHLNASGDDLDQNFNQYCENIEDPKWKFDFMTKNIDIVYSLPFVNAASWLLPKTTISKVGLFDPIFFHYGEDENYCQRLRYHGLKVGIVPSAQICHDRDLANKELSRKSMNPDLIELKLKIELCNINYNLNLRKKKNIFFKQIIKSLIDFNMKNLMEAIKKYNLINKLTSDILKSRELNKKVNK